MSIFNSPARVARHVFIVVAAGAAALRLAAQAASVGPTPPPSVLDPFVTTATRTASRPQALGSAVSVSSSVELARSQISSLADALGFAAGAPVFASGARGSTSSVFLRGANSNQTLFLVDGIRLNDPNADYQVVLGGASLGAHDVVEIVRGPQSTLYGAEAIGGVVSLQAARGAGPASGVIAAEGGSFGTVTATLAGQGGTEHAAWNFSAGASHTDNDRPNNEHDAVNSALRLDRTISERVSIGGTLRWFRGDLGSPGDRFTDDPNNRETESNLLATLFTDLKCGPEWSTHVILGGQDRRFVADSPSPNPPWLSPSSVAVTTNRRAVLDLQTTYTGIAGHRVTAGGTGEINHARSSGFGAIDRHQRLLAFFAQDEITISDGLYVTAGLRRDDFDTFGAVTTGRASVAWLPIPRTLKLRASHGTGFRSPSFLDLYGRDAFYVGNPSLDSERARGTDAGFDWYVRDGRGLLSVTWFRTEFRNLIEYDFSVFPSTVRNIGQAETKGAEVSARWRVAGLQASLGYTYLDAVAKSPGQPRLLRRPRHQLFADLRHDFPAGVTAGVGVRTAVQREDVHAALFSVIDAEDFTVVRAYARWQATPRLALTARIENALDETYDEVHGYPALGLGGFGGVEWRF